MILTVSEVSHIAHAVIDDASHGRHLYGVTATDGGTGRVEILMTMGAGRGGGRLVMLNVSREAPAQLERELREKMAALI